MTERDGNLSERLLGFASRILKLASRMEKDFSGKHISGQIIRSGTSAGANYEEACGAESKRDFVHKLQIVLKELKETFFWLRLIRKSELTTKEDQELNDLIRETNELVNIIAKSVITTKRNIKRTTN